MFFCCDCGQEKNEPTLKIKKIDNYIYKPNDKIGQGQFSSVYMGVDELTGTTVAVKVVRVNMIKSNTLYSLLQSQIDLMKDLKHPNILQCFCAMNSPNNCYIITEYCQNGDMQRYLKVNGSMDEEAASKIAYDVFKGLEYLAKNQIVHRDLKVANVFLREDGVAKIGDFGFAVKTGSNIKDISVGSPAYMSPQALLRYQYGPKTDIWSFGVLLYELVHGETPLGHLTSQQLLKQQIMKPPKFKSSLSKELKNFIMLCMDPNERTRINIRQIRQTPFMKKIINSVQTDRMRKSHVNTQLGIDRHKLMVSNALAKVKIQEATSLLHYCRLIHKATKEIPSMVLSQWLLTISDAMIKAYIQPKSEKSVKLLQVMRKYHRKYTSQHNYPKLEKTVEQAIKECQQILRSPYPKLYAKQLLRESSLLKKSFDNMSLATFTKYSNAQAILKELEQKKENQTERQSIKIEKH